MGAPLGERAITAYKALKGAAQLALAVLLLVLLRAGVTDRLVELAEALRHQGSHAWAVRAAMAIFREATPRHVELTALALALDGALSLVEGWALHTRRWWGRGVVVVSTGSLIPFEIAAIARHPHAGRVVALALNVAMVGYLGWRAWRHHAEALALRSGRRAQ